MLDTFYCTLVTFKWFVKNVLLCAVIIIVILKYASLKTTYFQDAMSLCMKKVNFPLKVPYTKLFARDVSQHFSPLLH